MLRGNLSVLDVLRPLEALITSITCAGSRPWRAPNSTASQVAASAAADR